MAHTVLKITHLRGEVAEQIRFRGLISVPVLYIIPLLLCSPSIEVVAKTIFPSRDIGESIGFKCTVHTTILFICYGTGAVLIWCMY